MSFAHLTLATQDVAAAVRFYRETLDWLPIREPANIEEHLAAAWLEIAPGQQLHLLRVPDFAPSPFEQEFGRHVAIFRPGSEFPALRERLTAAGAELMAPLRETPFERFFFRTPDGYVFEVIDQQGYQAEA
jgi:catechol 2,3-dioxygenase-like lactoylglutathione lyase family enzyme